MSKSVVALLRTKPETVNSDYQRLLDLVQAQRILAENATTIIKDNISWHLHFPGANTTPWQLESVLAYLTQNEFKNIISLHNNTVVNDPVKGAKLNKLTPIFEKYHIKGYYNYRPEVKWIDYQPKAQLEILPRIFPKGLKIPELMMGTNIIHLPTVKAHIYTTTTGAMKNAFGGLLNTNRHYTHSWIHQTLVDLLKIQLDIHKSLLAVMDGTTCGNGPGPRTMIPINKGVILASFDQLAIDAVAAYLMGFDPMKIDYLRLAHEAGLGCAEVADIEIIGNKDLLKNRWNFYVGDNLGSFAGDKVWFGKFKKLQHLCFHTPLVYIFIATSYIYHDWIWYNFIGRWRRKKWLKTEWGKFFQSFSKK